MPPRSSLGKKLDAMARDDIITIPAAATQMKNWEYQRMLKMALKYHCAMKKAHGKFWFRKMLDARPTD